MEPISLSLMVAAAGRVLDALLGERANKVVAAIVGGVIGNQADRVLREVVGSSLDFFKNVRTHDPALNHDLERATREAYLVATLELIRQAALHVEVGSSASRLMTAGDAEALAQVRRGIESDLRNIETTLPRHIADSYLFLVDAELVDAGRISRLREALRKILDQDFLRWLPGTDVPKIVNALLTDGWTIDTAIHRSVRRDWHSLIAIAFIEKLKSTPRLSVVFESRLLAQIAAREPAAAPMSSFAGFAANLETITAPLQRIEDTLGVLGRDISDIKVDVREIRESISFLGRVPRLIWMSSVLLVVAAATVLATNGGTRAVCQVAGIRAVCAGMTIGGIPSAEEESLWQARTPGNCDSLRSYLSRFPSGAYAVEASRLLAARTTHTEESWIPQEKWHIFTVRVGVQPSLSERDAQQDALTRGERDAEAVCAPYSQDEYQLGSARAVVDTWRCFDREGGIVCGFDGAVVCEVRARQAHVSERCQ